MYASQIEIQGFRGLRFAQIPLGRHTVLIGPNNAGKSSVIDALGLVIGRARLVRDLSDHDFYGSTPKPTSRIRITLTLTGFGSDEPSDCPDWFNRQDGAVPVWWDSDQSQVVAERGEGRQLAAQIRFAARFDRDSLEVETVRYFLDGEEDPFETTSVTTLSGRHLKALGFFLLPSRRTWDRILSFSSELFKRVVRFQEAIPGQAILALRDALRDPEVQLESEQGLAEIISRIEAELAAYVGESEASLKFRPTTGDVPGVLAALTPSLPGKGGSVLPLGRHGAGVVSLQTLLLLMEVGRARKARSENFILAAEEPELHLHPGHHRRLVARIQGLADQSLLTTHSPEVAAYSRPDEIVFLRNDNGDVTAQPLLSDTEVDVRNVWIKLFTVHRQFVCEALMGGVVVVPEGITEFRWFRLLARASEMAEGWEHDDKAIRTAVLGCLPTPDSHVVQVWQKFSSFAVPLVPLVDGDESGREYARALRSLESPPRCLARLADDCDLERVLSWILAPESEEEWQQLQDLLEDPSVCDEEGLWEILGTSVKTRWDLHEDLAGFVATREKAAGRARSFLDALVKLGLGDDPSEAGWQRCENESTEKTRVWLWSPDIDEADCA